MRKRDVLSRTAGAGADRRSSHVTPPPDARAYVRLHVTLQVTLHNHGVAEGRVPVSPEASRVWTEVAQGSRLCWHMFTNCPSPAAGSNFARARELYPFEPLDERARAYVGAALEHLMMWAEYAAPFKFHTEHESNFQQRPPYTLARAALEAAAQAVWMLDSRSEREVIRRHLSLIRWDLHEHRNSKATASERALVEAREQALVEGVAGEFEAAEIKRPRGYLWILQQACQAEDLNLQPAEAERLWRAASGSAHGMYWPTLDLQMLVNVEPADGPSRQVRVADAQGIAQVLQAAFTMTQYAVLRYADFTGADIPSLMMASRAWLLSKIPLREDADLDVVAQLRGDAQPFLRSDPARAPRPGGHL